MPENDNKLNRFDKDESDAKTLRIRLVGISFVVMGLFSMFFLRRTEGWFEDYWRVMIGLLLIFGGLASIVWARSFANDEITDDENEITDNKTEVRDDKAEVSDDKTEVRDDKAEVGDDEVFSWALVWDNDAEAMARVTDAEARLARARARAEVKPLARPEAALVKVKEAWAGIVKAKARHAEACVCANKAEAEGGYKKTNATWAEAEAARGLACKIRANADKAGARVAWTMVELAKAEVAWTEAEAETARADETATWASMIVRAKARLVKAETEYTKSIDCWSWQTNLWNWFKGSGNK